MANASFLPHSLICGLWCLLQEGPKPAVSCKLLVSAAEPSAKREQGPRHTQRPLPHQRHHTPLTRQRGQHTPAQESEDANVVTHIKFHQTFTKQMMNVLSVCNVINSSLLDQWSVIILIYCFD